MKTVSLLGISLHCITRKEAAKVFVDFCKDEGQKFSATPNAEIILEAQKNPHLKKYLQACSLNVADSVSLLWAAMLQEKKWSKIRAVLELAVLPLRKHFWTEVIPERVCGSDIFYDICEEAEQQGRSVFLLGGMREIPKKTKEIIQKKYPQLKVLGGISGSPFEKDDEETVTQINKDKPEILFLAYGCPLQELWIERNLKKCPTLKVACGIGGTFDFVTGNIQRAPKLFQFLGLEWFWRLMLQPSRAKRILRAVFVFPYVFLRSK